MSTTEEFTPPQTGDPTYGNWHRRPKGGLYNLGPIGTAMAGGGAIAVILTMMITGNLVTTGTVLLILSVAIGVLLVPDKHNRNTMIRLNSRIKWWKARYTGSNLWRSGPLTPQATNRLPGILGTTTTTEWVDAAGKVFVLVSYKAGYHTIIWNALPDGATNVDKHEINTAVSKWGDWLANHGDVTGICGASVTIETAPDTGGRLRRENVSLMKDWAPKLAKDVLNEVMETYPAGSADVRAWISMSFTEKGRITRAHSEADRIEKMAASLALEIPEWTLSLNGTGAGVVRPMDVQTLCEIVRVAYDPAAAEAVEEAHAAGVSVEALNWNDVGPVACDPQWDYLVHDSGISITSVMTMPPRQNVHHDILRKMLEPSKNVLRKRVTIHYRPLPMERASAAVESDLSNAIFAHNADKKKTAKSKRAMNVAQQTAEEEVSGAGLTDFAIASTITLGDMKSLEDGRNTNRNLGLKAKLRMRVCYGFQDSSFAFTLPLGFQPKKHINLPRTIKRVIE